MAITYRSWWGAKHMAETVVGKAAEMGRMLRLKGSVGFWVGALLLLILAVALFTVAKPAGEWLGGKFAAAGKQVGAAAKGAVSSGAGTSAGDPRLEGL